MPLGKGFWVNEKLLCWWEERWWRKWRKGKGEGGDGGGDLRRRSVDDDIMEGLTEV